MPSAEGGKEAEEPFPLCGAACVTLRMGGNEFGAAAEASWSAAERLEGRWAIKMVTSILRGNRVYPVLQNQDSARKNMLGQKHLLFVQAVVPAFASLPQKERRP